MAEWGVPSREDQRAHLFEIKAYPNQRVRFRSSDFEWEVDRWLELRPTGSISVQLVSPTTGRRRTAWPWELRAAA